MKIKIENGGVTIIQAVVRMVNQITIMLNISTKEKYPEFMYGKSYSGDGICDVLLVTFYGNVNSISTVTLEPENNWEQTFIQECEHYQGSTRYGPEILYIVHKEKYKVIGCENCR